MRPGDIYNYLLHIEQYYTHTRTRARVSSYVSAGEIYNASILGTCPFTALTVKRIDAMF